MAVATPARRQRGPRSPNRCGYRHAAQLPTEPTGVEVLAAIKQTREQRGRLQEWDARIEASAIATLAYLWRRARGEKWAGKDGSARYACSLAQLVAGLAGVMGWTGNRDQLVRRHRASVRRWLDWLQDAGLVSHTPQQDDQGFWWRTIIELHATPGLPAELLQAAVQRRRGWAHRERQRDRRGRRRNLTTILRRARLNRSQRRARAVARRRQVREHGDRLRVRATILGSLDGATSNGTVAQHVSQPFGAETTSRIAPRSNPRHETDREYVHARPRNATAADVSDVDSTTNDKAPRMAATAVSHAAKQPSEPQTTSRSQSRRDLDSETWTIANEAIARWRDRGPADQVALVEAVTQRTVALEADWSAGRACAPWRLAEAWTTLAWGAEYAAAGASARLAMWSGGRHGDRLSRAIRRYERHAEHRPDGWPASGVGALIRLCRHRHPEPGVNPRCLAYDVKAFDRFTRQLRAHAATADLDDWTQRAASRARRRATRALAAAGEINRSLPERAWLKPASELIPLPYPSPGGDRKQRRLADRDRRLLAGQAPLSAGTLRAGWAFEDRWLNPPAE
ncbi:MAG: hypothetical protein ABSG43_01110 [Solirubrobacteraceae bacterium]|jgi:hypothetical protein